MSCVSLCLGFQTSFSCRKRSAVADSGVWAVVLPREASKVEQRPRPKTHDGKNGSRRIVHIDRVPLLTAAHQPHTHYPLELVFLSSLSIILGLGDIYGRLSDGKCVSILGTVNGFVYLDVFRAVVVSAACFCLYASGGGQRVTSIQR